MCYSPETKRNKHKHLQFTFGNINNFKRPQNEILVVKCHLYGKYPSISPKGFIICEYESMFTTRVFDFKKYVTAAYEMVFWVSRFQ